MYDEQQRTRSHGPSSSFDPFMRDPLTAVLTALFGYGGRNGIAGTVKDHERRLLDLEQKQMGMSAELDRRADLAVNHDDRIAAIERERRRLLLALISGLGTLVTAMGAILWSRGWFVGPLGPG